jgi:hypothetical protein
VSGAVWELRLYEDRFPVNAAAENALPAANRVIYMAAGSAKIDGETLPEDEALFGAGAVGSIAAGTKGATLWRWELAKTGAPRVLIDAPVVSSTVKLIAPIETLDPGDGKQWLMRGDSVAFPPGGCAYTHVHQGPGIRCLQKGKIRIDCEGHSEHYLPGGAWFEAGPDPVFAQADAAEATRFVRVMVLPRALKGQSSIRYVKEEDKDKPKSQTYRGYVDEFIEL